MPNVSTEHIQPSDFLENLGCQLSTWQDLTRKEVESQLFDEHLAPLMAHTAYLCNPDSARMITDLFHLRVSKILELHRQANDPADTTVMPEIYRRALKGMPVLQLIFDKNVELGSSPHSYSEDDPDWLPIAFQICEQHNWQGEITVDLTDNQPGQVDRSSIPYLGSTIHHLAEMLKKRSGRPFILIIDGYGKEAVSKWKMMLWDDVPDGIASAIIRTTKAQHEQDGKETYGSNWTYKMWFINDNPGNADNMFSTALVNSDVRNFDQDRFVNFAKGLNQVIGMVEKGQKVCLQAPNEYGKTTAFKAILKLPLLARRTDLAYAYLAFGDSASLTDYKTHKPISVEELKQLGITTLIVDEAGRIGKPGAHNSELLEEIENAGINVVRVYPGNVTPPEGYEVIKLG